MEKSSFILLPMILGGHFVSGYVRGKDFPPLKSFMYGAVYGIFGMAFIYIYSVAINGMQQANELLGIGSLIGGIVFVLASGFYCVTGRPS